MRNQRFRNQTVLITMGSAFCSACLSSGAAAWTNPLENRYTNGDPLSICDEGGFFVGGVPKVTAYASSANVSEVQNFEQIIIGQMYVQFQIPTERLQWPVIMIHGSTHTGAALDATPDGHEGWLPYAVRNNLATFVVDQPGRGRSGFDQSVLHEAKATGNWDLVPSNFGRITDNRAWTTWFGHIIPDGTGIIDGTMIRHGDLGDPQPTIRRRIRYRPFQIRPIPISSRASAQSGRRRIQRTMTIWDWSTTSSWCRTRRSPCPAPSVRPVRIHRWPPSIPGCRWPWPNCWKDWAAASWRRIRNQPRRYSIPCGY